MYLFPIQVVDAFVKAVQISGLVLGGLYLRHTEHVDVSVQEQVAIEQYSVITFLGGAGPYMQFPGYGISPEVPEGSVLESVQMLARHGERYPTPSKGAKYAEVVAKLKSNGNNGNFQKSLKFLNTYVYDLDPSQYGLETTPENSEGLFSGIASANRHGRKFRERYASLYNSSEVLPVFTSSSNRVYHTSLAFAQGFLGGDLKSTLPKNEVKINIISEEEDAGANSLTPNSACANYDREEYLEASEAYTRSYLRGILQRFERENPVLDFSSVEETDIAFLFDLCAYELNVKSKSHWCDVFTTGEYKHYQYYKDLGYYYGTGPGNSLAPSVGSVLLNASLALINQDHGNKIWLSFMHDAQLDMFMAALGLFTQKDLSSAEMDFERTYIHAHIIPQGARIYLERFRFERTSYVRVILNESVVPIRGCYDGPGYSCGIEDFNEYVISRLSEWDYGRDCGLQDHLPQELTFYWDWNEKDYSTDLIL